MTFTWHSHDIHMVRLTYNIFCLTTKPFIFISQWHQIWNHTLNIRANMDRQPNSPPSSVKWTKRPSNLKFTIQNLQLIHFCTCSNNSFDVKTIVSIKINAKNKFSRSKYILEILQLNPSSLSANDIKYEIIH